MDLLAKMFVFGDCWNEWIQLWIYFVAVQIAFWKLKIIFGLHDSYIGFQR